MAAVLLSANPTLSHQEIKEIITRSADNYLPDEPNIQGAGVLNAERALELALNWDHGAEADKVAQSVERNRTPDNSPRSNPNPASASADYNNVTASVVSGGHEGFLMA